MFRVFKNVSAIHGIGKWENIGEFQSFDDAHTFATTTVCADVAHEGSKMKVYWFSDNHEANEGYKVAIDASEWFNTQHTAI